jgi:hypothetical protein
MMPLELGRRSSLLLVARTGELCAPLSPSMSTLLRRLCRALSTFLSLSRSCSKLAPLDGARADEFCVRAGRCAAELLLEVGVILV